MRGAVRSRCPQGVRFIIKSCVVFTCNVDSVKKDLTIHSFLYSLRQIFTEHVLRARPQVRCPVLNKSAEPVHRGPTSSSSSLLGNEGLHGPYSLQKSLQILFSLEECPLHLCFSMYLQRVEQIIPLRCMQFPVSVVSLL